MSEDRLKKITEQEKKLIIARLEVLSSEIYFSDGKGEENFSRDEMIRQVEANSKAGREFVKTELDFLRAIKDGTLMELLTSE